MQDDRHVSNFCGCQTAASALLELRTVTFEVNRRILVSDIDLSFDINRVHALVGHNGSGKSTLLRLLARQLISTQGSVKLNGRSLSTWSARGFAREVAYLPQQPAAADNLSARELVELGRYPRHGLFGRQGPEDRRQVDRALELTKTGPFADRLVDSLSGGERQRVWLAMLLAQDTRFLLLDEPLAALDVAYQVDVMAMIRELCNELKLGVIIVLHDINMAARACDRVVALHSGKVLADEPIARFMDAELLRSVYGISMEVVELGAGHQVAIPRLQTA